jgi:peptidoglycan/xylan/chitin deacetylase (PgdA/CDA1 family)
MTNMEFNSIIRKEMKKPPALKPLLVLGLILSSCVSRPAITTVEDPIPVVPEPVIVIAPPEIILTPMEQLHLRIRQNGNDIGKYFFLDDDGQIIVKAVFHDGENEFEVIYDLENIRVLGSSVFEVDFFIEEIHSGAHLDGTLIWRPVPAKEGLLLALDDNFFENWERYFDFFDEYDAKITFFIQGRPSALLSFSHNALSRGHDVGYHSLNHLDLRRASRVTFNRETVEPLEFFRQEGIPISSFAFPYGFSETWMHETLLQSFGVLRGYGTTFRLYSEEQVKAGYIISRAIDNTVIQGDENFQRTILLLFRTLKFLNDGQVLPLTTHIISDTAAWGISPSRLEFLFKTASDLQLKFYRYCDFIEE